MQQYLIKPSVTIFIITVCLYGLAGACLLFFFKLEGGSILLFLLLVLWLYLDARAFYRANKSISDTLTVNSTEGYIDLNNSHQFNFFTVYTNRSSIIIKLRDKGHRQNLILLADRFRSRNDYLECRYHLIRLNQGINAS